MKRIFITSVLIATLFVSGCSYDEMSEADNSNNDSKVEGARDTQITNLDVNEVQKVTDTMPSILKSSENYVMKDENIYFLSKSMNEKSIMMKYNISDKELSSFVTNGDITFLTSYKNHLYYYNNSPTLGGIWKVSYDGSDMIRLSTDRGYAFQRFEDTLYYLSGSDLHTISFEENFKSEIIKRGVLSPYIITSKGMIYTKKVSNGYKVSFSSLSKEEDADSEYFQIRPINMQIYGKDIFAIDAKNEYRLVRYEVDNKKKDVLTSESVKEYYIHQSNAYYIDKASDALIVKSLVNAGKEILLEVDESNLSIITIVDDKMLVINDDYLSNKELYLIELSTNEVSMIYEQIQEEETISDLEIVPTSLELSNFTFLNNVTLCHGESFFLNKETPDWGFKSRTIYYISDSTTVSASEVLFDKYKISTITSFNGYLYYSFDNFSDPSGIWRVRCDGSQNEKVLDNSAESMIVVDNALFFLEDGKINRYVIEEGNDEITSYGDRVSEFFTDGQRVVYSDYLEFSSNNSPTTGIYLIDIDNPEPKKISNGIMRNLVINGDFIYYLDVLQMEKLYRMNLKDGEKQKVINLPLQNFAIVDEVILFSDRNFCVGFIDSMCETKWITDLHDSKFYYILGLSNEFIFVYTSETDGFPKFEVIEIAPHFPMKEQ